ncbi:unnamed protein product [Ectocarpus sp. 8 AP-2014]
MVFKLRCNGEHQRSLGSTWWCACLCPPTEERKSLSCATGGRPERRIASWCSAYIKYPRSRKGCRDWEAEERFTAAWHPAVMRPTAMQVRARPKPHLPEKSGRGSVNIVLRHPRRARLPTSAAEHALEPAGRRGATGRRGFALSRKARHHRDARGDKFFCLFVWFRIGIVVRLLCLLEVSSPEFYARCLRSTMLQYFLVGKAESGTGSVRR